MMCVSASPEYGLSYHLWDLPIDALSNPVPVASMAIAIQILFIPTIVFTKVSVLCTYLRIFPSNHNRWFCYIMVTFTSAWAIMSFFMILFQCNPAPAYWHPFEYPHATCMSAAILYYTTGGLNVAGDFLIFLWPANELARIQMPLRQKLTLIMMFTLGIFICVAGVCRIWYVSVLVESTDVLYNGAALYAIISVESGIGIICGCIPALRPLLTRIFSGLFATANAPTTKKPTQEEAETEEHLFDLIFQQARRNDTTSRDNAILNTDTMGDPAERPSDNGFTKEVQPMDIERDSVEWIMMSPGIRREDWEVRAESPI